MNSSSKIIQRIKSMDKFVVSAIHGFAAGAGFSLALASDFIIADEQAKFISSFTNIGLIPDLGLMKGLLERIPTAIAKEWIVSGKVISAQQALQFGLVNTLCEENLLEEAKNFSQFIIKSPPLANQFIKFMAEHINEYSDATNLMQENIVQALLLQSNDNEDGISAFFEKRKPYFKGD